MEKITQQHELLTPQKELKAFFLGIMSQRYNADKTINSSRLDRLQQDILEFTVNIKKNHSVEDYEGSEAYHMLIESSVKSEKKKTPDPLFDEVHDYIKKRLAFL